jgi:hypothetical protein
MRTTEKNLEACKDHVATGVETRISVFRNPLFEVGKACRDRITQGGMKMRLPKLSDGAIRRPLVSELLDGSLPSAAAAPAVIGYDRAARAGGISFYRIGNFRCRWFNLIGGGCELECCTVRDETDPRTGETYEVPESCVEVPLPCFLGKIGDILSR